MMTKTNFNQTLDILNEYDVKLSQMVSCYDQAMISLGHLKFNNPYCPVSTRGFKVTPALKKVNSKLDIVESKDAAFTNRSESDTQQRLEEEEIQKQLNNEIKLSSKVDIINRFGNISQRAEIQATKQNFDRLLKLTLDMAKISLKLKSQNE